MIKDQLDLFADRQEAIQLFEDLCERKRGEPWPILPVLSLVGPSGYGKSLFIQYLYFHYANIPALPHVSLDFERRGAPHDLLNILGTLRNSLSHQRDAFGRELLFPRFDIIYSRLKRTEGQDQKDENDEDSDIQALFGDFSDLIGLVGNLHFLLGLFLFLLSLVARLPFMRSLLRQLVELRYRRLGAQPQWLWYQDQVKKFRELNLPSDASVSKIRARLNEMCTLSDPEREFLIQQILPKAFLADLRYGQHNDDTFMLQEGPRYIIIFLDSFEVLVRSAETTARQLLEVLALNDYRKRGESDPLLLVVGSEERLPEMSRGQLNQHFSPEIPQAAHSMRERALALRHNWEQALPPLQDRRKLKLSDMYLPLPVSTLELEATRDYLLRLDQRNETQVFVNEALVEDIHHATLGYPIFLERVAAALQLSTQDKGPDFKSTEELFVSEQGEQIVDRLLRLHCIQAQERALMCAATPRILTRELLGLLLNKNGAELGEDWDRYRRFPFVLASEDRQYVTFLPGVRALFLRKLRAGSMDAKSDYQDMHEYLYDYFNRRISQSFSKERLNREDTVGYCYHALALGRYEEVIHIAEQTLGQSTLWDNLTQVLADSPTQRLPRDEIRKQVLEGLAYLRQRGNAPAQIRTMAVRVVVLASWQLADPGSNREHVSSLWDSLGQAYESLERVEPSIRPDKATYCHRRASEVSIILTPLQRQVVLETRPGSKPLVSGSLQQESPVRQFLRSSYHTVRNYRVVRIVLFAILIFAIVATLLVPRLLARPSLPIVVNNPYALPLAALKPTSQSHWLGVTVEADGEFVGVSDGSIPFDYLRPDGVLKIRAASQIRMGDLTAAATTLRQAVQSDTNDAEALIALQNVQARLSGKTCVDFMVVTRIIEDSSEGVNNGRDNLQGAYVAQKEYDDTHTQKPICLYIANLGANSGYEPAVAQQIVKVLAASHAAIQGLLGWPGLFDTSTSQQALSLLSAAQVPIVSPDSYDEVQFAPNVFHVASSDQDQGRKAAEYAEHSLHKQRALVISDPDNTYSRCLTEGFEEQFQGDGQQIVAVQTYVTGHTDPDQFSAQLQHELALHPDFVYFTGGVEEGSVLLASLSTDRSPLPLLGGDALYPFLGFSVNTQPDFQRLAFTSTAYADAPDALHMKDLYASDFDTQDVYNVRNYGYSRPDSDAILSYDAMETLIAANTEAIDGQNLLKILPGVRVEGASRNPIAFTDLNALSDQSLFVIHVNQQEQIQFSHI